MTTQTTGSGSSVPGVPLGERLQRAFHTFGRGYEEWVQDLLTEGSDLGAMHLRMLCSLGQSGPQIMTDLGETLGVTPRYVTALVDTLEQAGLATRVPHPTDRRAIVIEPTEQGLALGHSVAATYEQASAELIAVLTEKQQRDLLVCLDALIAALRTRGY